jgi:hypothetical protein
MVAGPSSPKCLSQVARPANLRNNLVAAWALMAIREIDPPSRFENGPVGDKKQAQPQNRCKDGQFRHAFIVPRVWASG